jgi:hypothetical protein
MEKAKEFYDSLFQDPSQQYYKLIWSLQTKQSHWFKKTEDLIKHIRQNPKDVFHGICMTDKRLGSKRRATADQVTHVCALHLDIDIADATAHSKTNLPKTTEEALEIAHKFLTPTFIIFSGHGIHPYYMFSAPYDLRKDRQYFMSLSRQFQEAHRKAFPQYQIDYTQDLARVLRCPGSVNNKDPENSVECKIIEHNKVDYWMEEIEDAIEFNPDMTYEADLPFDQKSSDNKSKKKYSTTNQLIDTKNWGTRNYIEWFNNAGLICDTNVSVDAETWVDIEQSSDGKLSKLYNRTEAGDMSINDMKLANMAVNACVTDQDVIDLLIMHRRKWNEKPHKLGRKDYYARTLIKANSNKVLDAICNSPVANKPDKPDLNKEPAKKNIIPETGFKKPKTFWQDYDPTAKQQIRQQVKALIGVDIRRIICLPKEPQPIFELELMDLPERTIKLGTHKEGIMNQANFRSRIGAMGLPMPNKVGKDTWDPQIINYLRVLTEVGEIPITATYEGQINTWLREYISSKEIAQDLNEHFTESESNPFMHKDRVFFKLETLQDWIRTTKNHQIDFTFSSTMLATGFVQEMVKDPDGRSIMYWASPKGFL